MNRTSSMKEVFASVYGPKRKPAPVPENYFTMLLPPRIRPVPVKVLRTLRKLNDAFQAVDAKEEAQAMCVCIELIEQVPRLMKEKK